MGIAQLLSGRQIPFELVLPAILAAIGLRFALVRPMLRRAVLISALLLMLLLPSMNIDPAQARQAQTSLPEESLQAIEIHPPFPAATISNKVRGSFEPAECRVHTGYSDGFANLRSGPGMSYPVLEIVPEDEALVFLGQTGDFSQGEWRRVRAGSQVGWIHAPLCLTLSDTETAVNAPTKTSPESFSPPAYAVVSLDITNPFTSCQIETGFADGWANVRSGPGMDFPVTQSLPEAAILNLLGEAGDFYETGIWYEVLAADDARGWIFSELCRRDED